MNFREQTHIYTCIHQFLHQKYSYNISWSWKS